MKNLDTTAILVGLIVFTTTVIILKKTKPKVMLKYETTDKLDLVKTFFLSLLFGSLASFCFLITKKEIKPNPLVFLN